MAFPIIPVIMAVMAGVQAGSTAAANKKQQQSNEKLAREQRDWNERMFDRTNEYNDPAAQMGRLEGAGLNPRLIYGQSSGSSAGNAGDVKGYDRAEATNVMQGVQGFQDLFQWRQMEAQTNNIQAQERLTDTNNIVQAQEGLNKALDNKRESLKYQMDQDLYDHNVDAAIANTQRAQHEANRASTEAMVAAGTSDARIRAADAELQNKLKDLDSKGWDIKNKDAQYQGQLLENTLKQLSIDLRNQGIYESDNVILRLLLKNGLVNSASEYMEKNSERWLYSKRRGDNSYIPSKNK